GWTPQKSCPEVSKKFHNVYEAGLLKRLTTGEYNGYPGVCAVAIDEESCNSNNQLFTLKNNSDPGLVLEQLVNIAQGKSSEPLWQSSGNSKYLNVRKYLQNAPLVNIKK
ncbi:MAG: COP23 domain-containing protein, partial [Dolichospermum sp.]